MVDDRVVCGGIYDSVTIEIPFVNISSLKATVAGRSKLHLKAIAKHPGKVSSTGRCGAKIGAAVGYWLNLR